LPAPRPTSSWRCSPYVNPVVDKRCGLCVGSMRRDTAYAHEHSKEQTFRQTSARSPLNHRDSQNEGYEPPDATALLGIRVPGRSASRREFALMSYRDQAIFCLERWSWPNPPAPFWHSLTTQRSFRTHRRQHRRRSWRRAMALERHPLAFRSHRHRGRSLGARREHQAYASRRARR
jgi:hypothetical protein